jgi:hypothetical protein
MKHTPILIVVAIAAAVVSNSKLIQKKLWRCIIILLISFSTLACQSNVSSELGDSSAAALSVPGSHDLAACERITRGIYNVSVGQSDVVPQVASTRFGALLNRGWAALPGYGGYLNHDFRYDTQDDIPDVVSFGPATASGGAIMVPVGLRFRGFGRPFTKTWIFIEESGRWRVDDVVTSGHENGMHNGSLAADLEKNA